LFGTLAFVYDSRVLALRRFAVCLACVAPLVRPAAASELAVPTMHALGALKSVARSSLPLIEYVTDGLGRRVAKKVGGTVSQRWLYGRAITPIAEVSATGGVVARYVYGTRGYVPDHMIKGGVTYRLVTDQVGSVRLVVNTTTGAVAQRLDYDTFGRVTQDTSPGFQPFAFAGGLYDLDTGFVRLGARDYDPSIGRWTAKDPTGFRGGDANLYAYSGNDPVNYVDVNGLNPILVAVAIGAAEGFIGGAAFAIGDELLSDGCVSDWGAVGRAAILGAALGGVGSGISEGISLGREFAFGRNFRVAPFGNRTGHPLGELPHYHRRTIDSLSGRTVDGQGIGRHRPWEVKSTDSSFWDRF